MTEKKKKILNAAIELFIQYGFHATSTSKVAKRAGVSEGLIFRHFESKRGLLQAILEEGNARIRAEIEPIVRETDPREVIRKCIHIPFSFKEENLKFWQLQTKLRWELGQDAREVTRQAEDALCAAFKKLEYPSPRLETLFLSAFSQGIIDSVLFHRLGEKEELKQFILKKYNL